MLGTGRLTHHVSKGEIPMKIRLKTRALAALAVAATLSGVALAGPAQAAPGADLSGVTTNTNDYINGSVTLALAKCTVVATGALVTPRTNVTEGEDEAAFTATCDNGGLGSWGFTATATIQYHNSTGWHAASPAKSSPSFVSAAGVATAEGTATGLYGAGSAALNQLHRVNVCITSGGVSLGCIPSLNTWVVPDETI
jgi:hypothetical protein